MPKYPNWLFIVKAHFPLDGLLGYFTSLKGNENLWLFPLHLMRFLVKSTSWLQRMIQENLFDTWNHLCSNLSLHTKTSQGKSFVATISFYSLSVWIRKLVRIRGMSYHHSTSLECWENLEAGMASY